MDFEISSISDEGKFNTRDERNGSTAKLVVCVLFDRNPPPARSTCR